MNRASNKPTMPDCAEDLLILERRTELTEPEQRRLQMCLAASDGLQLLRQVGHAFDVMPTETSRDVGFTDQMVANITAQYAPGPRTRSVTAKPPASPRQDALVPASVTGLCHSPGRRRSPKLLQP